MVLNYLWVIHSEVGNKNFNLFILKPRKLPGILQGFFYLSWEKREKVERNDSFWQGQVFLVIL